MTTRQHAHAAFFSSAGEEEGTGGPSLKTPRGAEAASDDADADRADEEDGPASPPKEADFLPLATDEAAAESGFPAAAGWESLPPSAIPPSWVASSDADAGGSVVGSNAAAEDALGLRRRVTSQGGRRERKKEGSRVMLRLMRQSPGPAAGESLPPIFPDF